MEEQHRQRVDKRRCVAKSAGRHAVADMARGGGGDERGWGQQSSLKLFERASSSHHGCHRFSCCTADLVTVKVEDFDLGLFVTCNGVADRDDALGLELVVAQAVQREGREGREAGSRQGLYWG